MRVDPTECHFAETQNVGFGMLPRVLLAPADLAVKVVGVLMEV